MSKIRVGLLGLGNRGRCMLTTIVKCFKNVEIVAVCDPYPERAEEGVEIVRVFGGYEPYMTLNSDDVITRDDIDTIMIFTSWEAHVDLAIQAMRAGKKVAMEVGGAYSLHDCNRLIDVYHETGIHVMMLENACYCPAELAILKMVREGLFGEIVHCEGGYMHDLRDEVAGGNINKHYRLRNYLNRNCENYPTHELGPIAKILNINAGNKMNKLISVSSKSVGIKHYINERLEEIENKDLIGVEFKQGDIVNTIITCENGETISLKLDTTLPRYYSREFTVRGTKAMYEEVLNSIYTDGEQEFWETDEFVKNYTNNVEKYYDEHLPPFWKNITEEETKNGHGGMDAYEFDVFFHCLENDIPSPIDVYDAASWMAITPLSEESIKTGKAVEVPDFTKGKWKERKVTPINIL